MAWEVKYFRRVDGSIPGFKFQESLPEKLAAKLLRITKQVADNEGLLGGGYFEICHSHPGICETRARLGKDLARFLCTRDDAALVILCGVLKAVGEATPEGVFLEADALLNEYKKKPDTV